MNIYGLVYLNGHRCLDLTNGCNLKESTVQRLGGFFLNTSSYNNLRVPGVNGSSQLEIVRPLQ